MMAEHPLRVWNPDLGPRTLLLWWTENKQNQLSIVSDRTDIDATWKSLQDRHEHEDVAFRRLLDVVLVPVPSRLAKDFAQWSNSSAEQNFKSWLLCTAGQVLAEGLPLPEGFEPCPHNPNGNKRWGCLRCGGHMARTVVDWHRLYDNAEIRALHRQDQPASKALPATVSDAPLPFPDKPLMVAHLDEGHHHNGIVLTEQPEWWYETLFFSRSSRNSLSRPPGSRSVKPTRLGPRPPLRPFVRKMMPRIWNRPGPRPWFWPRCPKSCGGPDAEIHRPDQPAEGRRQGRGSDCLAAQTKQGGRS